ncbi:MAG: hypothetical protein GY914_03095 [Prochlorococcus sp.]|nr:hypothetical protein [Prochlorococcus sp.]
MEAHRCCSRSGLAAIRPASQWQAAITETQAKETIQGNDVCAENEEYTNAKVMDLQADPIKIKGDHQRMFREKLRYAAACLRHKNKEERSIAPQSRTRVSVQ